MVRFKAKMRWENHHSGDLPGPWFNAWLEIEAEGSDSVFIHHVEAVGAHFGSTNQAILNRWDDLRGGQSITPLDGEDLPRHLTPGNAMLNPWWFVHTRFGLEGLGEGADPLLRKQDPFPSESHRHGNGFPLKASR